MLKSTATEFQPSGHSTSGTASPAAVAAAAAAASRNLPVVAEFVPIVVPHSRAIEIVAPPVVEPKVTPKATPVAAAAAVAAVPVKPQPIVNKMKDRATVPTPAAPAPIAPATVYDNNNAPVTFSSAPAIDAAVMAKLEKLNLTKDWTPATDEPADSERTPATSPAEPKERLKSAPAAERPQAATLPSPNETEKSAIIDSQQNLRNNNEEIVATRTIEAETTTTTASTQLPTSLINNNVAEPTITPVTVANVAPNVTAVVTNNAANNNNIEKEIVTSEFDALKRIPTAKSVAAAEAADKAAAAAAAAAAASNPDSGSDSPSSSHNPLKRAASSSQSLQLLQYEDGQWSPQNADGRKFYKRDQLITLRDVPASNTQPECINSLGAIAKLNNLLPKFIQQPNSNNNNYNKQPMPSQQRNNAYNKRPSQNSQQGGGQGGQQQQQNNKGSKSGMIHVSLSLREEVKLNETANAWKPTFYQNKDGRDDKTTESLYKRVRGVLNKLTPEKFDPLLEQMTKFDIDSVEKLNGVIVLVFEKAIDEPNFAVAYALLCQKLSLKWLDEKPASGKATGTKSEEQEQAKLDAAEKSGQHAQFKKALITKCQTEFFNHVENDKGIDEKLAPFRQNVDDATDLDQRAEYMTVLEEEERKLRRRSVGTVKFIGELYKIDMLTTKIMSWCVNTLLCKKSEDKLECLCKLLTTVGQKMEQKTGDQKQYHCLADYFKTMQMIVDKKMPGLKVSSRVRFMLQDVIELRKSNWSPRRNDSNPKTMGQIQKEAEQEQNNIHILNYVMPGSGRKDDRGGVDRGGDGGGRRNDNRMGGGGYSQNKSRGGGGGGGGGGSGGHQDDGWSSVQNKRQPTSIPVDTSKFRQKSVSFTSIFLLYFNRF